MVQKFFSFIYQISIPDNPDSLQTQEVLLLDEVDNRKKNFEFGTLDDGKKALDKNHAKQVGSAVENMLKTGRFVTQSTLDLKEKAGIGGSVLGPLFVHTALQTGQFLQLHIQKLVNKLEDANFAFSQNIDLVDVAKNITGLDPKTTLV
ncbi:unnamed protein product [Lactuca saligna]|uniref:Uncharacterized protein n=1 Tax=Lactuca saligna TaxID=75948 RepID=A0AA35ZSK0_LACSI|nr:unnamed protein product [Lactuca saligna]